MNIDAGKGRELQQQFSDLLRDKITPGMQQLFDRLGSPDEMVRFNLIEIDIGRIKKDRLSEQFPQKLMEGLAREMGDLLLKARVIHDRQISGTIVGDKVIIQSLTEVKIERLIQFLKTGRLVRPGLDGVGGTYGADRSDWTNRAGFSGLLEELLIEEKDATVLALLTELKSPRSLRRFIFQLNDELLRSVMLGLFDVRGSQIRQMQVVTDFALFLAEMNRKQVFLKQIQFHEVRYEVWRSIFGLYSGTVTSKSSEQIITVFLEKLFDGKSFSSYSRKQVEAELDKCIQKSSGRGTDSQFPSDLEKYIKKKSDRGTGTKIPASWDRAVERFRVWDSGVDEERTDIPSEFVSEKLSHQIQKKKHTNGSAPRSVASVPDKEIEQPEMRSKPGEKLSDGLLIQNAGLVLIYPFLPTFLERVGLVKKKQFVDESGRQRAVHLLQFLVNDSQESPEEELMLNKILCGLESETPVIPGIEINKREEKEAANLLQNVVVRWTALKNSSPESVQKTFMQRDGILRREGHSGWKIIVERESVDVLLQKLPWGLSAFKLPWMSTLVNVEW